MWERWDWTSPLLRGSPFGRWALLGGSDRCYGPVDMTRGCCRTPSPEGKDTLSLDGSSSVDPPSGSPRAGKSICPGTEVQKILGFSNQVQRRPQPLVLSFSFQLLLFRGE